MELFRILLKVLIWVLVIGFGSNMIMQSIAYGFYKGKRKLDKIDFIPSFIQYNNKLTGYGYNLESNSDCIILFFGGSNYIAYNSIGRFAGYYDAAFLSADYYGSQESEGKMNLTSMKQTSIDLYDWSKEKYPNKKVIVMGHSYGTGIAAYLASVRNCDNLILLSAYRDLSDLYNKIIPIFWGPMKIFISNNINLKQYAQAVHCKTYILSSDKDKTLNTRL